MMRKLAMAVVLACAACSPKAEAPQTAAAPATAPAMAASAPAVAPAAPQAAPVAADPVVLVKTIYAPYLAPGQHPAPLPDLAPWSEELAGLIKKMDEVSQGDAIIDVDPVIAAQDWKLSDLNVALEAPAAAGKAVAVAKFKNLGAAMTVKFDLIETPKGWRVDNIRSTDANLRADITRGIADAGKPSDH